MPIINNLRFGVKPKYIPKPITRWGIKIKKQNKVIKDQNCLLYTSPSPRDA